MAYASWSVVANEQPSAAKWNILGTNDAYFDSLIGSGTAWTSFTPSYANLTEGAGANTGHYQQLGKMVFVKTSWVFGAGAAMGTSPTLTLPVTSSSNSYVTQESILGNVFTEDSGTAGFYGAVRWISTTTVDMVTWVSSTANLTAATWTSSVPMTWATNDSFTMNFYYEAA